MNSLNIEKLKLVMWDLDGTILDSREQHFRASEEVLQDYGIKLSRNYAKKYFGQTAQHIFHDILKDSMPGDKIDEIIEKRDEKYREVISEDAEFLPGVHHWLDEFYQHGISQVIVSSTAMENIKTIIKVLGAEKYFSRYFSGEDLPSKPDPAVFTRALNECDVTADACLVFEDSPHGIEAAHSVGLKCIASAVTYPRDSLSAADLVVENFDHLQWQDIEKLFGN